MQASVGDRIVIRGHHTGEPNRDGEVLEVRGADGGPPYVVRWSDTGRVVILYQVPTRWLSTSSTADSDEAG
jgi:hypothetical protein